jgi:nucleotide-binding universal stress UspA family protein
MPSTIVVGVDGSPASRAAVDWAARRALRFGSEIRLVHSVPEIWAPPFGPTSTDADGPAARALDAARARVAALLPAAAVHTTIRRGDPAVVLGDLSQDAGMVVVGADKPADARGEGFGAVGLQIVTRSACTVAIIPSAATHGGGVVVGVDGSPEADRALRAAAGEAEASGQALTIVHAAADPGYGRPRTAHDESGVPTTAERGERVLDAAAALVGARHPRVEVHRVLDMARSPAEALAVAAEGAALVVVGSRGRESVKHVRPGAIGPVVLARIACPVLVTTGAAGAA